MARQRTSPLQSAAGQGSSQEATVLVVDDIPEHRSLLTGMLKWKGYHVRTAGNGTSALAIARRDVPDLVLLDVLLPDIDGYTVCEQLKADTRTRDIPVIFVTAVSSVEEKARGLEVGGVDYIVKPFQPQEVLARVETHISLHRVQRRLEEQNERLRLMSEIGQLIVAAHSPESIAVAVVGRIRQLIGCQRVVINAVTTRGQLKTMAAETSREIPLQAVHAYNEVLANPVLQKGHVYGVPDITALAHLTPLQQALHRMGIRAYVVVPLRADSTIVGTLHLESSLPHAFTANHVAIAAEVAAMLALAIRQSQLYALAQKEIAERKRTEEALRRKAMELETRNAELDAFAHTVAHDLKTPLSTIVGMGTLLVEHYARMDEERLRQNLRIIVQTGYKMNSIINELLLLASVRTLEEVPIAPLRMDRIVREAKRRLKGMLMEYGGEIIEPAQWPEVLGYAPWVEEVWVNYISNAIKYGGRPPRVQLGFDFVMEETATTVQDPLATTITFSPLARSPTKVRFWVRDNGQGIPPEEQARLFAPFQRLRQVRVEGYGLGLSIVRRIVERLGGEVGVESEPGRGSRFYFTLPAAGRKGRAKG